MQKIVNGAVLSLCVVGVVLWILMLSDGAGVYADIMFVISYVILAVPLVVGLWFVIRRFIENPGSFKKLLYALVGILVVVGVSYSLSDGTPIKGYSGLVSSLVDTGLYIFYIQSFVVVALMVYFSVRRGTTKK